MHCFLWVRVIRKKLILSFQSDFRTTLEEWREDYGDIVGFYMGSEPSVILSDFQTIAEYDKKSKRIHTKISRQFAFPILVSAG